MKAFLVALNLFQTIFDKVKDFNQTAKDIQFGSWFPAQIAKQKEKKEKADSLRGLHDSNAEDFEKKGILTPFSWF